MQSKELVVISDPSSELAVTAAETLAYASDALAPATLRAYTSDLRQFKAWCLENGQLALPALPITVAHYIDALELQGSKAASITRKLAAITWAHEVAGLEPPTHNRLARNAAKGMRRRIGTAPAQVAPVRILDLRQMLSGLDRSHALDVRDKALLLIGHAGAFRRSELVALDVADLRFIENEGVLITVRRSKTDQEGAGMVKEICCKPGSDNCPVAALAAWLEHASITEGPVFRGVLKGGKVTDRRLSDKAVALIVKARAGAAGMDTATVSGHSLRAGFATDSAAAGIQDTFIMRQTGHKSSATLAKYVRLAEQFKYSPTRKLDY